LLLDRLTNVLALQQRAELVRCQIGQVHAALEYAMIASTASASLSASIGTTKWRSIRAVLTAVAYFSRVSCSRIHCPIYAAAALALRCCFFDSRVQCTAHATKVTSIAVRPKMPTVMASQTRAVIMPPPSSPDPRRPVLSRSWLHPHPA